MGSKVATIKYDTRTMYSIEQLYGVGSNMVEFGGGDKSIPFASDAFEIFSMQILDVEGTKYFKGKNRNLLITDYDFDSTWIKNFPWKSAATVSAPAGDAEFIAFDSAHLNNFWYTSGTPNQIPVICFFSSEQGAPGINSDYGGFQFAKSYSQSVDYLTQVETYEPRVKEIVIYNTAKTGADLDRCNNYFKVPIKQTSNIREVGVGKTYETIEAAITAASTGDLIYIYTGTYSPVGRLTIQSKSLKFKCIGNVTIVSPAIDYVIYYGLSAGTTNTFEGATFDMTATTSGGIFCQSGMKSTFSRCYIKNINVTVSVYLGGITMTNCNFYFDRNLATTNNPFKIAVSTTCNFYNNYIKVVGNVLGARAIFTSVATSNVVANIYNNKIVTERTAGNTYASAFLLIDNSSTHFYGNKVYTETTASEDILYMYQTNITNTDCHIHNNLIIHKALGGHSFEIGQENTSVGDNLIQNMVIESNLVLGAKYFDSEAVLTNHGIFVGFNSGAVIRYNKILGSGLSIVIKGTSTTTASDCIYNLVDNSYSYSLYLKGVSGCNVYGNTLIRRDSREVANVYMSINSGADPASGSKIKNNIIANFGNPNYKLYEYDELSIDHEIDNNIIYNAEQSNIALANAVTKDIDEWRALGYDVNSQVLDPNLTSGLWPATALLIGAILDESYKTGLDISTNWGSQTIAPNVLTKEQPTEGNWQVGAYVQ